MHMFTKGLYFKCCGYQTFPNIIIIIDRPSICKVLYPITLYRPTMISISMFESIAYIGLGFVTAFLSLEVGWHFTACKYKSLKPCFYKQIGILS